MLDRENGVSEFGIKSINIINYLNEEFKNEYKFNEIKIPRNLYVFATMNTSDQNVFTLDNAFKRRWNFEKIKNKFTEEHPYKHYLVPKLLYTWQEFVEIINEKIITSNTILNSEDKLLGIYFVKENLLQKDEDTEIAEENIKKFAYKVFEYLWNDVSKFDKTSIFEPVNSLDELIDNYLKNGLGVFNGLFKDKK